jgi:hypothetical protein
MSTHRLSAALSGLKSKRVVPLDQPEQAPPVAPFGGWAPAADAAGAPILEPEESARAQRQSGAAAMADLNRRRESERRAEMDNRLAGVQRGYDLSQGIYARSGTERP